MGTKVKLGNKANGFYDQSTGISVYKGDVVELDVRQLNSPRVKRALAGGHLVYAPAEATTESKTLDVDKLVKSFNTKVEKGMTVDKLVKAFTMEKLKAICEASEIEVEEGDTEKDLVEALLNSRND